MFLDLGQDPGVRGNGLLRLVVLVLGGRHELPLVEGTPVADAK